MIGGAQPKVLVTQDEYGNLKMDEEMSKVFFGDRGKNWKLVRERDGLTQYGSKIGWIEWNDDSRFKEKHDGPAIGRSFILDPHRMSYTWMTTIVTEIIEESTDYVKFKTSNSVYELYKLYDAPTGNPI